MQLGRFAFNFGKLAAGACAIFLLSACGGSSDTGVSYSSGGGTTEPPQGNPESKAEASRFLAQASFGPQPHEIDGLIRDGYIYWLDQQFSHSVTSMRTSFESQQRVDPTSSPRADWIYEAFWKHSTGASDQLRQRVAYALSQIFVISMRDANVKRYPKGVSDYYDVLTRNAFGNFRQLLQQVSLHPMMGLYLSHLGNRKADLFQNRVPDENYAREVMQLFTIGLYELNIDGSNKLDSEGKAIESYTNEDVKGLAKVFTGFSWNGPDAEDRRFLGWSKSVEREYQFMQGYPQFHSTADKSFLGLTIPAQIGADPMTSLNAALDHLFNHPNVGPFISRQLIQRLVTSNPSPAYIARVAAQFNNNGEGQRGDMRATIRAILFDPEARDMNLAGGPSFGKVREPVLRFAHWLRSFNATSKTGDYMIHVTDDSSNSLGQTVLRSPSVFNFYRPGYAPPNSPIGDAALVAPEMQITHETSVAGWLNMMRTAVKYGWGSQRDVKPGYAPEAEMAKQPAELVEHVNLLLMHGTMSNDLRARILSAVESVSIAQENPTSALNARKNRVYMAIYLAMASPEYIVLK